MVPLNGLPAGGRGLRDCSRACHASIPHVSNILVCPMRSPQPLGMLCWAAIPCLAAPCCVPLQSCDYAFMPRRGAASRT
jgi:hypothetical protein